MDLRDPHYSEGVLKEVIWLGGAMGSFERAQQAMARVGHIHLSDSTLWRRKEGWGEVFQAVAERERQRGEVHSYASARRRLTGEGKRLGVSLDGVMVNIRQEGYKELKVGCTFEIEVRREWDADRQEWEDIPHAVHNRYVAHLGGPEVIGEMAWAQAQQRGWEWARDREALGDGAEWIWNQMATHFHDARSVVDWGHSLEHLATIGDLLHGENSEASQQWYRERRDYLYQGQALRIAGEVRRLAEGYGPEKAKALHREAGYFQTHHRRMQYMELREEGYLIGSGMVESGGKQYKARFCGPGMSWNRRGIERLIPIRTAIMSECFDSAWQAAYHLPPN